jgi:hypothetical protein
MYDLPLTGDWVDVRTLTGESTGTMIINNSTPTYLFVAVSPTKPPVGYRTGYRVEVGDSVHLNESPTTQWVLGHGYASYAMLGDSPINTGGLIDLSRDLFDDKRESYRRVKVDAEHSGFYSGEFYRTFHRFTLPAGQTMVMRIEFDFDVILRQFDTKLTAGALNIDIYAGGTTSGTPGISPLIIPVNTMTTNPKQNPASLMDLKIGMNMTHSGGTLIDVDNVIASTSGNHTGDVVSGINDMRGVGAGLYYWVWTNSGNNDAVGVIKTRWQELTSS